MVEPNGDLTGEEGWSQSPLLDVFPLSESELEILLELHKFRQNNEDDFSFSSFLSDRGEPDRAETQSRIEEFILPEKFALILIKAAIEQVVVLGCKEADGEYELRKFLEAMVTCLGRRGPKSAVDVLVHACISDAYDTDDAGTFRLWVYQMVLASHALHVGETGERERPLSAPASWSSASSTTDWATWTAPHCYTALSTLVHLALFSEKEPFRPSTPPLVLPQLDKPSALLCKKDGELAISLALMSPNLGGSWRRLYSNDEDACSFRTMQMALISYKGPTVILIRSVAGDVFGFSTDCPWKLSPKWYGEGSDSFLFTVSPKVAMYPSTGQGKHHQYLNLPPQHRPQDLKGLAIGGISYDRPRLHITESLETCRASAIDVTYQVGPILSDDMEAYFDIDVLEVWATCVEDKTFSDCARKGKLLIDVHEAYRRKAATVDKAQFVDDFASGAVMNKAFAHRQGVDDGRCASIREFRDQFKKPSDSYHLTKQATPKEGSNT